jgi:hypothetical protein
MPPMPEHLAQSQEFMIVDIVIPLCFIHSFGEESHWVKDVLLISLHEDCSYGIIRCVYFDFEWFRLIWLD